MLQAKGDMLFVYFFPESYLFLIFLTDVLKLYHSCAKALRLIWKNFLTAVKNIKYRQFYAPG